MLSRVKASTALRARRGGDRLDMPRRLRCPRPLPVVPPRANGRIRNLSNGSEKSSFEVSCPRAAGNRRTITTLSRSFWSSRAKGANPTSYWKLSSTPIDRFRSAQNRGRPEASPERLRRADGIAGMERDLRPSSFPAATTQHPPGSCGDPCFAWRSVTMPLQGCLQHIHYNPDRGHRK